MSTSPTTKSQWSAKQAIFRWTFPGAPIRIDMPIELISRLRAELGEPESSDSSEVGGVLLGERITSSMVKIDDYLWISQEQPGAGYHLDPSALERLREVQSTREEDAVGSEVVGYFRTQARDDLHLRDDEISLVREHFQNPTDVVLLIQTSDEPFTSGFFFWMREGEFAPLSFMDFPLDARLLPINASRIQSTEPASEEEMTRFQDAAPRGESPSSPGAERISTLDGTQARQSISNAREPGTVVASTRKVVSVVALLVLLAVGALCAFLLQGRWSIGPKGKAPATVAAFPLQLDVEARGDALNVRWNPQSAAIAEARDGRLVILEGDQQPPRIIPLNLQQLTSGHVYYRSSAERIQFQLEIVDRSGGISRESVLALSAPSAVAAPRSSPAQAANPQVAAKKVQSIPIPSIIAAALPNANTTEAPPKGQSAPRVFTPPPSSSDRTPQLPTITFEPPPTTQTTAVPPGPVVLPAALSNLPANVPPARQVKEAPVAKQVVIANLQVAEAIKRVMPVYPPMAMERRIQGTVRFLATIGKDGRVKHLEVVSGNPLFVKAATDAVKQWIYRPALQNGVPVEMTTQIDLNFMKP